MTWRLRYGMRDAWVNAQSVMIGVIHLCLFNALDDVINATIQGSSSFLRACSRIERSQRIVRG